MRSAIQYAIDCHEKTNHLYDGMTYVFHLASVFNTAAKFHHLLPTESVETVYAACWAHDLIEDTRQTYNDVKNVLGEEVADIVFACTNEKGKNRKERANEKFYTELKANPLAVFVKVCDRIANIEYSMKKGSNMLFRYVEEVEDFERHLYLDQFGPMFLYINSLLRTEKSHP